VRAVTVTKYAARYTQHPEPRLNIADHEGSQAMTMIETRGPDIGDDIRVLRGDELDAVSGGTSLLELARLLGELENKQAEKVQKS
jgi:hypothetical protein